MKKAKYISRYAIDENVPRKSVVNGRVVSGDLPEDYLRSIGFLDVVDDDEPEEGAGDGRHWEKRYSVDGGVIVVSYESVPDPSPPPRSLSKRKLYRALLSAGLWGQVESYMKSNGVWEDWEFATTLDEDDPLIVSAVSALESSLGLSHEQVSSLMDMSVAS